MLQLLKQGRQDLEYFIEASRRRELRTCSAWKRRGEAADPSCFAAERAGYGWGLDLPAALASGAAGAVGGLAALSVPATGAVELCVGPFGQRESRRRSEGAKDLGKVREDFPVERDLRPTTPGSNVPKIVCHRYMKGMATSIFEARRASA